MDWGQIALLLILVYTQSLAAKYVHMIVTMATVIQHNDNIIIIVEEAK